MRDKAFDGKLALVTGAGTGIGRAISLQLASKGAKIYVTDLNLDWAKRTASEIIRMRGNAIPAKLDVTNSIEVDSVIDSCWRGQGPIHFLINNAGVSTLNHIWDLTEKNVETQLFRREAQNRQHCFDGWENTCDVLGSLHCFKICSCWFHKGDSN